MKTSKVFELVKDQLVLSREPGTRASFVELERRDKFICVALESILRFGQIKEVDCDRAVNIIQSRIAPYYIVEEWVIGNVPVCLRQPYEQMSSSARSNQMQAFRHRWLDALVVEFKAKGD